MSLKIIDYMLKCKRGDCTYFKKFQFPIEAFDPMLGDCILNNQEIYRCKCTRCQTQNMVDFDKVCNREMINLAYYLYSDRDMGYKRGGKRYLK